MKSSYTFDDAMSSLEGYGEDGRTTYLWISLLVDTLFPMVYVTFFAGAIYRFKASEGSWWLAYIPVFGGVWDLVENAQISIMLVSYPVISEEQVAWASAFTYSKHWIGGVYLILALALFLFSVARAIFAKFRSSQ